jgi:CYTH domain-containing protein
VTRRREPGRGRYAQREDERRFLLSELPSERTDPVEIVDRYLEGTRLRLRCVGGDTWKLTQKVRVDEADPSRILITNIYLSETEHGRLAALPAAELRKVRWRLPSHPGWSVDVFSGALAGLVLASSESPHDGRPPVEAVQDVTFDEAFTGGALAWKARR